MNRADRWPWTVLLAATVLMAAALRFISLGSGLWMDEIYTLILSARRPVSDIVTEFANVNVHPLYSVLAHASMAVFGESAWTLRLPACLFGIACVPMAYACAALVTTRIEAWAAAAILTVSYHHVWFSQNARGYTMLAFFTLLATDALMRAGRNGRRAHYITYALACAAGIYTHLTMAFVVAGHAAVVFGGRALGWGPSVRQPLRPLVWAWTAIAVFSLAAYAPFAAGVLAMVADDERPAVQVATVSWGIGEAIRGLLNGGMAPVLAVGVVSAVGACSLWRRQPLALALLAAPGAVTVLVLLATAEPLRPRFFFFLTGAAAILAGRGMGAVVRVFGLSPRRESGAIAFCTVALMAMSAVALPRNYQLPKQDFDGAISFLDVAESQGRRIAVAGPACELVDIYFRRPWHCIDSLDDWRAASDTGTAEPLLIVHTLAEYTDDRDVLRSLQSRCPEVRRFPGTLGGGDLVVCEAARQPGS